MNSGQTAKVNRPQLNRLLSSELASIEFIAGTDESLFAALAETRAVVALRDALGTGEISESEIREFTNTLLKDFRPGELFEHDLVLAALATTLSKHWNTPFAEEFIIDLAKLNSPEFRRSTAVARIAAEKLFESTETISRTYKPIDDRFATETWQLLPSSREECSDQLEEFTL